MKDNNWSSLRSHTIGTIISIMVKYDFCVDINLDYTKYKLLYPLKHLCDFSLFNVI